jgi:dTDP-4-amino-4,6-dideoxygalactose transaminase
VLTSANVPLAVASAAQLCGGGVEFLDVDAHTGNLDVRRLEERLEHGPPPYVVTASHFAGLPCDMEWLLALKRRHDFLLVEEASHALGARYRVDGRWYHVGEHPEIDATVLAFGTAEHLTTGEGGALLVHDAALAARLRRVRAGGTDPETGLQPFDGAPAHEKHRPAWFQPMTELGFHCRMSDMQAALGASQLKKLPDFLAARREIALRYLAELRVFGLPHPGGLGESADREHAWSLFVIRGAPDERDELLAFLRQRGVQAEVHHYPLPLEPWFRSRARENPCPNAIAHARSALSLPLYPSLSDEDQGRVIAALAEWSRLGAVA